MFGHVSDGLEVLAADRNLVMATGTASGKTLVYNLAFASEAVERPTSTALYLFPTKALARDQLPALPLQRIADQQQVGEDRGVPNL